MRKQIAVLMTCHNRKDKTVACLTSLYACKLPDNYKFDVFLVDDGCTDGTSEAIRNTFTDVHIIKGDGNLFWNRGMQLAWQTASDTKTYDAYIWLNDDTYLYDTTIKEIITGLHHTNFQSIIVGATQSANTNELTYSGFNKNEEQLSPNGDLQQCIYFHGNCVTVPKTVFDKVGNLDAIFHHAIGDFDYGLRANKAGIYSYILGEYVGTCEKHDQLPKWCLPSVPFFARLRSLYSPLGNSHPYYFFRYELRHFGIYKAIKHLISIHLRVSCPWIWKK
jgi:GT2 family glycosyltransferase